MSSRFSASLLKLQSDPGEQAFAGLVEAAELATDKQLAKLARILGESGSTFRPSEPELFTDLSSTGGPTSLSTLLCPLFQRAAGFRVPKVGVVGRPAGAVDVLATIPGYNVDLSDDVFKRTIERSGYAHVEATRFAPLDRSLFAYRKRVGAVAVPPLAISSLLAKKVAVGLTRAGLEIRVAQHGNFGINWEAARKNGERFRRVAAELGIDAWVCLTDARFPFQPYIGRGESLLAVDSVLKQRPAHWLMQHLDDCELMALGPDAEAAKGVDGDQLSRVFFNNLRDQGSSSQEFHARVQEIAGYERSEIVAGADGWLSLDLGRLRDYLVSRQSVERPDDYGVILTARPGAHVNSSTVVALFRSPTRSTHHASELGFSVHSSERPGELRSIELITREVGDDRRS